MDILGPFYISNSSQRNYIVSCLDDCSRKVASKKWSERKKSVDVLNVLEDWIMINGKPDRVMHDNGKQFTSNIFRRFLVPTITSRINEFQIAIHSYKGK
jgi:transposase InsO family protein